MSREERFWGQDTVVDKYHAPNADYQMTTRDYVMRPSADGLSGPIVITLPPVSEARGRFYSIVCRNADAVNTVTVEDFKNDSECWEADIVMDGKCDVQLMYSDGMKWFVLGKVTTPVGTTAAPTSVGPTTVAPTGQPTSAVPTSAAPTSIAPTTAV